MSAALLALVLAAGFDWGTLPDEVEKAPIPGEMSSDGKPVHMELRISKASPQVLLKYCLTRMVDQGLYVPPPKRQIQGPGPSVTGLDPTTRTSYSCAVMPQKDGTSQVILGDALHAPAAKKNEGEWPPAYPAAQKPVRSNVEGARSVSFESRDPKQKVAEWYDKALTEQGYSLSSPGVYEKGAERVRVDLQAKDGQTKGLVWAETGPAH